MRLTIYIPTGNRPELGDLLASIPHVEGVEVFVSDNSFQGRAQPIVEQHSHVNYSTRNYNIGGDANILRGVTVGTGEYVWVIGDDDTLLPGAIQLVLQTLEQEPDRLMLLTARAQQRLGYINFQIGTIGDVLHHDPSHVIAATLITANVWRRDTFDVSLGLNRLDTSYPLSWAGLRAERVGVLPEPIFEVGQAPPVDAHPMPWQRQSWREYLNALCDEAGLTRYPLEQAMLWNFPYLENRVMV